MQTICPPQKDETTCIPEASLDFVAHRYRIVFHVHADTHLPAFPCDRIALLRQAFNHALKKTFCPDHDPRFAFRNCCKPDCQLNTHLATAWCEPKPQYRRKGRPPGILISIEEMPQSRLKKGAQMTFYVTLIGRINAHFLTLLPVWPLMAETFFRRPPGTFSLHSIREIGWGNEEAFVWANNSLVGPGEHFPLRLDTVPSAGITTEPILLNFSAGLVYRGELDGAGLVKNLLRRIEELNLLHCDGVFLDAKLYVKLATDLYLDDTGMFSTVWERKINHQQTTRTPVKLGCLELSGPGLPHLLPWLALGSQVGIGQLADFGMGQFQLC